MYIHYFLYTNALLNVGYVVIHYLKADKIFFFEYFISFVYCIIWYKWDLFLLPLGTQHFCRLHFRPTLEVLHLFPYFPYQFPVPVPLEAVFQYVKHLSVHPPRHRQLPQQNPLNHCVNIYFMYLCGIDICCETGICLYYSCLWQAGIL